MPAQPSPVQRMPPWLKRPLAPAGQGPRLERQMDQAGLATICRQGRCPNRGECHGRGVASFLVMGTTCTRNCAFCAVEHGQPQPLDPAEPQRLARQVAGMGLQFVVITSVTRDDLPDGGAGHLAQVTLALRQHCPGLGVELLVPDFRGSASALGAVLEAAPQVLAHNLETVPRLSRALRSAARHGRSLELLARAKQISPGQLTKSGLMLGLGESLQEVRDTLAELRQAGCDLLTLGQYLSPGPGHHPVSRYLHPQEFEDHRQAALALGFKAVAAGPWVRSSYLAEHFYAQALGAAQAHRAVQALHLG